MVDRTKIGYFVGGALFAGSVSFLTASGVAKGTAGTTVRAQGFVVEDLSGRERAVLGLSPDGEPTLSLNAANGIALIRLAMDPHGGAAIGVNDKSGHVRLGMVVTDDGVARLGVFDRSNRVRVQMVVGADGDPRIVLYDGNGLARMDISATDQLSMITATDNSGKVRVSLGYTALPMEGVSGPVETSALVLSDRSGVDRVGLVVVDGIDPSLINGKLSLFFADKDGKFEKEIKP